MKISASKQGIWGWVAVDDDTYDGAPDSNCPLGRGATEEEAINDLIQQLIESAYEEGWKDAHKRHQDLVAA